MYNTVSNYPNKVDELIFFQDNGISQEAIIDQYQNLIAQGHPTNANSFINQQKGINIYHADLFNLLENRIFSLQEHALTLKPKPSEIFSANEPVGGANNVVWVDIQ